MYTIVFKSTPNYKIDKRIRIFYKSWYFIIIPRNLKILAHVTKTMRQMKIITN